MVHIKGFSLGKWQQFNHIEIDSDSRLTILTGANGSGKTTLLRLIGRHLGWNFQSLAVPRKKRKGKPFRYYVPTPDFEHIADDSTMAHNPVRIGEVRYSNGQACNIAAPWNDANAQYQLTLQSPPQLRGVYLPSDRPEFWYSQVQQIPLTARTGKQAFTQVDGELRSRYFGGGQNRSPSYQMKEVLISLALFGYGNPVVEPDSAALTTFEGFQSALQLVMPPELGFERLSVRNSSEIVLETRTGDFLLDSVSGGVGALFTIAWLLYMFSSSGEPTQDFTVVIDEPENHLHPKMQRELFPSLLRAFPSARFIVATHSPLVVSSVEDSKVYALAFAEDNTVRSEPLDVTDWNGTASEVLRRVLGVSYSHPAWVQNKLESIADEISSMRSDEEAAALLRSKLEEARLTEWIPGQILEMIAQRKRVQ